MKGQGEWADLMAQRFEITLKRTGLQWKLPQLRRDMFRVPPKAGDQLSLF